ncbi:protein dhs-3-like isoform X2 [Diadema antillarum]|uniref:protein dhs-3-like isoform X2 n=1 Tax=Diadema antillarum TaxID=105358 RepID=UPI003A872D13
MSQVLWDILDLLWTIVLITFYNFIGFIKNVIPTSWHPHKDVSKDIVLITGGGMGLGRLMSLSFAKLGSTVVIWDINGETAKGVVKEIHDAGGKAYSYVVDCCESEAVYRAADKVRQDVGHVTILINNAGIVTGKKLLECPDRLIRKTMDLNINAHFWTLKSFLPHMLEKNHGHVVTIASLAGYLGVSGLVDYCASKFAAVGLDDALFNELHYTKKTGVKCTCVCPFYINTGMFDGVKAKRNLLVDILEPEYVVKQIMTAVRTNRRTLILPKSLYFFPGLKNLWNEWAFMAVVNSTDGNASMEGFIGRNKQN